jgi:hypothetical protein
MKRTQIYITEEQDRMVEARARATGVSKAEVIRTLLDVGLGTTDGDDARRQALEESFGAMADAPDWSTWLASVRSGRGADARLRALASEVRGAWDDQ